MKKISQLAIIFILSACVKDIERPSLRLSEQIVLNGLLMPDSTVSISLTKSMPLETNDSIFPSITDAEVELYENEIFVTHLKHISKGIYKSKYFPLAGQKYSIRASIPGYTTVTANDKIPETPKLSACFKKDNSLEFNDTVVDLTVNDNSNENNSYWIENLLLDYASFIDDQGRTRKDSTRVVTGKSVFLHSNSVSLDPFNAQLDNSIGMYEYRYYIRLEDRLLSSEIINLSFTNIYSPLFRYNVLTNLQDEQSVLINVISASQHCDRYLKSSLTFFLNNNFSEPNLFTEPIQIYSNVENGTGIFAAYNSVSISVEDFPCE